MQFTVKRNIMTYVDWRQLPLHTLQKHPTGQIERVPVYQEGQSRFVGLTDFPVEETTWRAFAPEPIRFTESRSWVLHPERIALDRKEEPLSIDHKIEFACALISLMTMAFRCC